MTDAGLHGFRHASVRNDLLFTMSDNMPACGEPHADKTNLMDDDDGRAFANPIASASPGWWSQTGSNRRPPACKAGALPAELWPRLRFTKRSSNHDSRVREVTPDAKEWWAWEDLNFRPHAYQARALTN